MIIILYGEDSFRASEKLKEIISEYYKKNENGINLKYLDDTITFEDLKNETRQVGMFQEKKLLVGIDLLTKKEIKKEIVDNLEELKKQDNILIFKENQKLDDDLVNLFKNYPTTEILTKEYQNLTGKKLHNWYKNQFIKNQVEIEESAILKLASYLGNDLWRAKNEINKLSNFRFGEKIVKEDISKYVKSSVETDIFETIDKLAQKNKKGAVELIENHLKKGDSAHYLIAMINYQIRNLLAVKELQEKGFSDSEIIKKSKLSYFVFKKAKEQSSRFSFEKLKKIHQQIFRVDLNSKRGVVTAETGIALIISEF